MGRNFDNDRFAKSHGGYDRHDDDRYERNSSYSQNRNKPYDRDGIVYRVSDSDVRKSAKQNGNVWEFSNLQEFQNLSKRIVNALQTAESIQEEQIQKLEEKKHEAKKEQLNGIRKLLQYRTKNRPEPVQEVIRVSIKFTCGSIIECNFEISDSLEVLFNTVFAEEKCPKDFSLLSINPSKELLCAPDWYKEFGTVAERTSGIQTFKEAGLDSSVEVLVKDNQAQT
uniref:UBX domain-containing protein n=1 Tax=Panagrolaimus superbus TaxID=310955 RepID=A0A914YXH2_9BILA